MSQKKDDRQRIELIRKINCRDLIASDLATFRAKMKEYNDMGLVKVKS